MQTLYNAIAFGYHHVGIGDANSLHLVKENNAKPKSTRQSVPSPGIPNANYILPAHVGGCVGSIGVRVGSIKVCVGSLRLFGKRYVGISNMKSACWGCNPMRTPKAQALVEYRLWMKIVLLLG